VSSDQGMNYALLSAQMFHHNNICKHDPIAKFLSFLLIYVIKISMQADQPLAPTHLLAASTRESERAVRRVLSMSSIPQVACSTESSRQSPAVRFHRAYRRLPSFSVISTLQFTTSSSVNSARQIHRVICV